MDMKLFLSLLLVGDILSAILNYGFRIEVEAGRQERNYSNFCLFFPFKIGSSVLDVLK
jgi:hypothetical protein